MPFWNPWWPDAPLETPRAPLPRVGETVRLHHLGDSYLGLYHARVRAVGPRRIVLDNPEMDPPELAEYQAEWDGLPPPATLLPRTLLTLSFLRDDNLYQCETRVVGPEKSGTLVVARPWVVTRLQRRQFYRLPLQSPTTFRVRGEGGSTPPIPARLVNLSGGGALLAAPKPVLGGLWVVVRVPVGTAGDLLDVEANVLDCRVAAQGRSRVYLVRLRFLDPPALSVEDREEIVAYIFEQQRVLLRTRKLLGK